MSHARICQCQVNSDCDATMSVTRCFTAAAARLRRRVIVSVGATHPGSQQSVSALGAGSRTTSTAAQRTRELTAMFTTEERGSPYAHDYRVYFKDSSGPISPLHDIPLFAEGGAAGEGAGAAGRLVNMVVEVPRWSNAKMEISLSEPLNPIKQDVKKGALRYVANVFPHRGYIWNYGALPQTWEDPQHVEPATGARGDNDPVDVLEIGSRVAARGDVYPVRVLGALALIDEGETDWKLLAIDARDPLARELRGPADIERVMPGLLRATVEWFRLYKVPDGKPVNQFAFDAQPKDAEYAHKVIDEVHGFWRRLVSGEVADNTSISTMNVSVAESGGLVERVQAAAAMSAAPARGLPQPLPTTVDKWHFVSNL